MLLLFVLAIQAHNACTRLCAACWREHLCVAIFTMIHLRIKQGGSFTRTTVCRFCFSKATYHQVRPHFRARKDNRP
uniref:Putative secreted protein n=1 Tax=Ixodes ricinus TaxID=34613 RepID=A0A6B0TZL3_IXORI